MRDIRSAGVYDPACLKAVSPCGRRLSSFPATVERHGGNVTIGAWMAGRVVHRIHQRAVEDYQRQARSYPTVGGQPVAYERVEPGEHDTLHLTTRATRTNLAPIEPDDDGRLTGDVRVFNSRLTMRREFRDAMGLEDRCDVWADADRKLLRITASRSGEHELPLRARPGQPPTNTGTLPLFTVIGKHPWIAPGVWPAHIDGRNRLIIDFS